MTEILFLAAVSVTGELWSQVETEFELQVKQQPAKKPHEVLESLPTVIKLARNVCDEECLRTLETSDRLVIALAAYYTLKQRTPQKAPYAATTLVLRAPKEWLYNGLLEGIEDDMRKWKTSLLDWEKLTVCASQKPPHLVNDLRLADLIEVKIARMWIRLAPRPIRQPLHAALLDRVYSDEGFVQTNDLRIELERCGRGRGFPLLVYMHHADTHAKEFEARLRRCLEDTTVSDLDIAGIVLLHRELIRMKIRVDNLMLTEARRTLIKKCLTQQHGEM